METTRAVLQQLIQTIGDQFAAELEKMPIKKSVRECLVDGYRQGVRSGVEHTVRMLEVKVHP